MVEEQGSPAPYGIYIGAFAHSITALESDFAVCDSSEPGRRRLYESDFTVCDSYKPSLRINSPAQPQDRGALRSLYEERNQSETRRRRR